MTSGVVRHDQGGARRRRAAAREAPAVDVVVGEGCRPEEVARILAGLPERFGLEERTDIWAPGNPGLVSVKALRGDG